VTGSGQVGSDRVGSDRVRSGPGGRELCARWLGLVAYGDGLRLQEELVRARRAGEVCDQLLLLEHPHVITLGTSSNTNHVLVDDQQRALLGIELFDTGRGGDVTYHGPGQLVGYPIFDLKPDRCDLHRYVRDLEAALMRALSHFGINAEQKPGLTGVWIGAEKVAAIGVRVSSGWITSHGFALNVCTDLSYFDAIVPCGIRDHGVTSISRAIGRDVSVLEVVPIVTRACAEIFEQNFESDVPPREAEGLAAQSDDQYVVSTMFEERLPPRNIGFVSGI
jgi:lipoyl(octanoyl) transferase